MMEVRFVYEVFDDLLNSMNWFDARKDGLGGELEHEFYKAVARIRENPLHFAADEFSNRPCRLKKFGAVVYFRIDSDCIVVLGLLVHGRDKS